MRLKLITGPKAEPIALDDAKRHLNVNDDIRVFDDVIDGLIVAAREHAEHRTGRALMPQVWELALPCFSPEMRIPKPPTVSITSVKYVDLAGTLQTLAPTAYELDTYSEPAMLLPAYGTTWPATLYRNNAVIVRYVAGYENAAAVPQTIKQWMLLQIGTLFENKESIVAGISIAELPFADGLLDAHKIWSRWTCVEED